MRKTLADIDTWICIVFLNGITLWLAGVWIFGYGNNIYGVTYFQLFLAFAPLLGFAAGLKNAKQWGGWQSQLGKVVLTLAYGQLAWSFAMMIWSYYAFHRPHLMPYPSSADYLFMLSNSLWVTAAFFQTRVIGITFDLRFTRAFIEFVIMPLIVAIFSALLFYFIAYKGSVDLLNNPSSAITDIFYAISNTMAAVIMFFSYIHAHQYMGGIVKKSFMYLFAGLMLYYTADFIYLYLSNRGAYTDGGISDAIYLLSITCISYGISSLKIVPTPSVARKK